MVRFFLLLCSLGIFYQLYINKFNVIYTAKNEYGEIYIADKAKKIRCLFFEEPLYSVLQQTCIFIDKPNKVLLKYQQNLLASLYINPNPKNILIIGLGGGTLINVFIELFPNAKIDVVELNPEIVQIAQNFFSFKPNNNTNIIIDDGYNFVDSCSSDKDYDVIILDVFDKDNVPEKFFTSHFVIMLKSILNQNGVVAINTLEETKLNIVENNPYKKNFNYYFDFTDGGNKLIFASSSKNLLNAQLIAINAKNINKKLQSYFDKPEMLLIKVEENVKNN